LAKHTFLNREQELNQLLASHLVNQTGWRQRVIPFLALSRTPHGIIDMAAPVLAALLCLGRFPSIPIMLVGLVTVFAGYTAIYALNDLVDLRVDKEKLSQGGFHETPADLDGILIRHPMAKDVITFPAGLAWALFWAVIAMAGAFWLNPACLVLFLAGALLEACYCKLFQVTPLRTVINGVVKSIGSLAAVLAVAPDPPMLFFTILFCWIFFWEIGGQNIPNDWTDIQEDRRFNAQTVPLRLGPRRTGLLINLCLVTAFILHMALLWASPLDFHAVMMLAAVAANVFLLLQPALALIKHQGREQAMLLFNRASYYPLATLVLVLVQILINAG
jgi:4-hydroxybenzoate polyprenyltransferase